MMSPWQVLWHFSWSLLSQTYSDFSNLGQAPHDSIHKNLIKKNFCFEVQNRAGAWRLEFLKLGLAGLHLTKCLLILAYTINSSAVQFF